MAAKQLREVHGSQDPHRISNIYLVNSIGRLADEELGARKVGIAYAFLDFLVERFNDAPWREPCALDQRL